MVFGALSRCCNSVQAPAVAALCAASVGPAMNRERSGELAPNWQSDLRGSRNGTLEAFRAHTLAIWLGMFAKRMNPFGVDGVIGQKPCRYGTINCTRWACWAFLR
jgi:hypothetical protein